MRLTALIIAKDEEEAIQRAIKSTSFCDEVIVIDDHSIDRTAEKSMQQGAKVFSVASVGDFSSLRNSAMTKARGDWLLFIDADEEVTKELRNEISRLLPRLAEFIPTQSGLARGDRPVAYRLKRRDYWWGRELRFGETRKVRSHGLIRLMERNSGKWIGKVHEEFLSKGQIGQLNSYINHYPHPTLKDFLREINYYSTLRAKELFTQRKSVMIFSIIFFPLGKFLLAYIYKLGFLDGAAGFAYAFMMSLHSFLVRAKLYQYTRIDKK